jgi:hypothetical protein
VFFAALNFRGAEVRQGLGFEFSADVTAGASQSFLGHALLAKTEFRKWGFVAKRTLAGGVGFDAGGVPERLWVAALAAQAFHAEAHDLEPSIRLPQIVTGEVTQRQEAVPAFGFRGASATKEKSLRIALPLYLLLLKLTFGIRQGQGLPMHCEESIGAY